MRHSSSKGLFTFLTTFFVALLSSLVIPYQSTLANDLKVQSFEQPKDLQNRINKIREMLGHLTLNGFREAELKNQADLSKDQSSNLLRRSINQKDWDNWTNWNNWNNWGNW